jgi:hypothetical protein
MLRLENVRVRFNQQLVLRDVSMSIAPWVSVRSCWSPLMVRSGFLPSLGLLFGETGERLTQL